MSDVFHSSGRIRVLENGACKVKQSSSTTNRGFYIMLHLIVHWGESEHWCTTYWPLRAPLKRVVLNFFSTLIQRHANLLRVRQKCIVHYLLGTPWPWMLHFHLFFVFFSEPGNWMCQFLHFHVFSQPFLRRLRTILSYKMLSNTKRSLTYFFFSL